MLGYTRHAQATVVRCDENDIIIIRCHSYIVVVAIKTTGKGCFHLWRHSLWLLHPTHSTDCNVCRFLYSVQWSTAPRCVHAHYTGGHIASPQSMLQGLPTTIGWPLSPWYSLPCIWFSSAEHGHPLHVHHWWSAPAPWQWKTPEGGRGSTRWNLPWAASAAPSRSLKGKMEKKRVDKRREGRGRGIKWGRSSSTFTL